jgi:hypothetical protein
MAISRLKLNEKSIGDGPRAPKCLLLEIRDLQGARGQIFEFQNFEIYTADSILKFDEKSSGDGPRAQKCLLLEI